MNILELEDIVKGLPDDRLNQEARMPSGQVPQFLLVSEVQRRNDMRKRYQTQQMETPQGTVADQILQQGIASTQPPQMPAGAPQQPQMRPPMPPQGMAQGGVVRMYDGGLPEQKMNVLSGFMEWLRQKNGEDDETSPELRTRRDVREGSYHPEPSLTTRESYKAHGRMPSSATVNSKAGSGLWPNRVNEGGASGSLEAPGIASLVEITPQGLPPGIEGRLSGLDALLNESGGNDASKGDASVQGGSKIQAQDKSILQQLIEAGNEKTTPADYSDLIADQKKMGFSNSLVQLGAGIAGNKMAEGLSKAGEVASNSQLVQGKMAMEQRKQDIESQQADRRNKIYALATAGNLEQAARNAAAELMKEGKASWRTAMVAAKDLVKLAYDSGELTITPNANPQQTLMEMEREARRIAKTMYAQMGGNPRDLPEDEVPVQERFTGFAIKGR